MTVGPNEPPSESSSEPGETPAEPASGGDQTTPFPLFGGGQSEPFPPFTGGSQTEPFPAFTGGGQPEPQPGAGFDLPPWGAPPPGGPGQPGGFDPAGPPPPPPFGPAGPPPYDAGGHTQPLEAGPPPPPFDPAGPPPPGGFDPAGPPPPGAPNQPGGFDPAGPPPPPQGPAGPAWSPMPPGPGGPGGPLGPPPPGPGGPGPYGPPGQFGPPPGGQYVPPGGPPSKGGPAVAIVILAIVLVVGLLAGGGFLVFRVIKGRAGSVASSNTSDNGSSSTSSSSSDSPSPSPSPTPTSLWTDDGHKAEVGQCFNDSGSQTSPNLTLNSTCSPGSYKVVQRITQTTDRERCGGDKNHTNWSVSYDDPSNDSNDVVLCLGYQYNDPAGSAIVGECVYGTSTSTSWRMSTCEPGAFQVIAKYYGTLSYDKCRERDDYREGISYTANRSELNVVLCTKYLYQDDAAYAKKNNCVKVKNEGSSWWMHFADCGKANAIVTGHTGKYQPSFCGNDGWVGYKFPDRGFKHLDYTVCWRRYP